MKFFKCAVCERLLPETARSKRSVQSCTSCYRQYREEWRKQNRLAARQHTPHRGKKWPEAWRNAFRSGALVPGEWRPQAPILDAMTEAGVKRRSAYKKLEIAVKEKYLHKRGKYTEAEIYCVPAEWYADFLVPRDVTEVLSELDAAKAVIARLQARLAGREASTPDKPAWHAEIPPEHRWVLEMEPVDRFHAGEEVPLAIAVPPKGKGMPDAVAARDAGILAGDKEKGTIYIVPARNALLATKSQA